MIICPFNVPKFSGEKCYLESVTEHNELIDESNYIIPDRDKFKYDFRCTMCLGERQILEAQPFGFNSNKILKPVRCPQCEGVGQVIVWSDRPPRNV